MKKKRYIKPLIVIAALSVLIYYCFHPLIYEKNYYWKLGIGESHLYESVVKRKGEPLSVRQNEDEDWIVYYDGLEIKYDVITAAFRSVTVTGSQHRFGIRRIGLGTPRKKIESVYRHIQKMKDLPDNEFGVIDGGKWVWFGFDENNNVSKITIADGL